MQLTVWKGHATGNDFVILDDRDGEFELSAALVRALCDRHAGIGADGVLRVVRADRDPAAAAMAGHAQYFMDYRNADGSIAEMCGNGARLFLRYLQSAGLAADTTSIATRGGVRRTWAEPDGSITVEMGRAEVLRIHPSVQPRGADRSWPGTAVLVPNPHVVIELGSAEEVAGLDLTAPPAVTPALPDGQNVEFVARLGPRHLVMRVHERGVGETQSCGTGICAAVVASAGSEVRDGETWQVDVPGGTCRVRWLFHSELQLTGPAVIVGEVTLDDAWLAAADPQLVVGRR